MIRYLLPLVFVFMAGRTFAQVLIPFEFTSEEDNRLIKENDSLKYYVATDDTLNIVCLDEEASYYKLLTKGLKVIAEGAYITDGDKFLQDGKWAAHHTNGKVKLTGCYLRNIPVGTWQEYYANGKLKTVSNYALIDDKGYKVSCLSGSYQEYYQNGKMKTSGFYCAVTKTVSDTIMVEDPITNAKLEKVSTHKVYSPEKAGHWENYDENEEQVKKEDE